MSYFGTTDYALQARRGLVQGVSELFLYGHSDDVTATDGPLHHEHDVQILTPYTLYDTPAAVQVASTDNTNDNSGGTGALTVRIEGCNSVGVIVTEDVTMNGTTATTATTAVFSTVHNLTVLTSGVALHNTGTIWCGTGTFTGGVPAVRLMSMEIGTSVSAGLIYEVPVGKKFYVAGSDVVLADTGTKIANIRYMTYNGSTEYETFDTHHSSGSFVLDGRQFPAIAAGIQLHVEASVTSGSGILTVSLHAHLVDD